MCLPKRWKTLTNDAAQTRKSILHVGYPALKLKHKSCNVCWRGCHEEPDVCRIPSQTVPHTLRISQQQPYPELLHVRMSRVMGLI